MINVRRRREVVGDNMDTQKAKQELRSFLEATTVARPLITRIARGGATVGGIYIGAKAVEKGSELYRKLAKLRKKRKKKKLSEAGQAAALWRHRKALAKILKKAVITGAAWTAGEKLVSKGSKAVEKKMQQKKKS